MGRTATAQRLTLAPFLHGGDAPLRWRCAPARVVCTWADISRCRETPRRDAVCVCVCVLCVCLSLSLSFSLSLSLSLSLCVSLYLSAADCAMGSVAQARVASIHTLWRSAGHAGASRGPKRVCHKCLYGIVYNSATGTRTRVARVRAEYPNQLDYSGAEKKAAAQLYSDADQDQTCSAVPTRRSRTLRSGAPGKRDTELKALLPNTTS